MALQKRGTNIKDAADGLRVAAVFRSPESGVRQTPAVKAHGGIRRGQATAFIGAAQRPRGLQP